MRMMVMKMEDMDSERAREYMEETDINRKMIIDYFNGIKADNDLYHAQFNTSLLNEEENQFMQVLDRHHWANCFTVEDADDEPSDDS